MKDKEARKIPGLDPEDEARSEYVQDLSNYDAAMDIVIGKKKARLRNNILVALMVIGVLCACGWWGYNQYQDQKNQEEQKQARITKLNSIAKAAISESKWATAEEAYQELKVVDPSSQLAMDGMKLIQQGRLEEQNQQLLSILGESQEALEEGLWPEAEQLAKSVLEIDPDNTDAKQKLKTIADEKYKQIVADKESDLTEFIDAENITGARQALAELKKLDPKNIDLLGYTNRIDEIASEIQERKSKAASLFAAARALDTGVFSEEAIALLAEAKELDPTNTKIAALHSKMNNYSRTISVPGEYPSITKALEIARPGDIIKIAAGTYKEAIEIHKAVRIQGAPDGKTILQLPALESSLITIHPEAKGTVINAITLTHKGFDYGVDRYSGMTVMAEDVNITSCNITNSGGHGIAIIKGGSATVTSCQISNCGWDGIAVYGKASEVTLRDISSKNNIQHGLGVWDGGSATVSRSNMSKNGLCGILAMGNGGDIAIHGTICSRNREAGILVTHGVKAVVNANRCDENRLSGIVVRNKETRADVTNNATMKNREAGILTHFGVQIGKFENNRSSGNTNRQIWRDAVVKESAQ